MASPAPFGFERILPQVDCVYGSASAAAAIIESQALLSMASGALWRGAAARSAFHTVHTHVGRPVSTSGRYSAGGGSSSKGSAVCPRRPRSGSCSAAAVVSEPSSCASWAGCASWTAVTVRNPAVRRKPSPSAVIRPAAASCWKLARSWSRSHCSRPPRIPAPSPADPPPHPDR